MNFLHHWRRWACAMVLFPLLAACADDSPVADTDDTGSSGTIVGLVYYLERMALPPGIEVEVQLQDISRPDALATTVASVSLSPDAGPPYPFSLEYDPQEVDASVHHALKATISHEGDLLYTTTEFVEAFSGKPVEILVQRVPEPVKVEPPPFQGRTWVLATVQGEKAKTGAGGKPIDLQLDPDNNRAAGFSGCNRYTGSFALENEDEHGGALKFGPMAGTLMACEDGGELERAYLQALGSVTAFRIEGDTLILLADSDPVASFR